MTEAIAQALPAGVVERNQSIVSPSLGREFVYNAYRPAAEPPPGRRWPVIFLLEGRPSESDWLDQGFVYEVIDKAVAEGTIPPSLVIMPVAPFSWYVDNPDPGGQGLVASAIAEDLVEAIDRRWPTAACRQGRAVGGLSMGGYGAVRFGLDRPETFAAAMSFAGAITPPIEAYETERLANADAFYDGAFGQPLDRARYNAGTPFLRLRRTREEPDVKAAFFLAIGDRDRGGLLQSLTRLHVELGRAGYDSTLRIGAGRHDWETWRAELAEGLAWLGPRVKSDCEDDLASRLKDIRPVGP